MRWSPRLTMVSNLLFISMLMLTVQFQYQAKRSPSTLHLRSSLKLPKKSLLTMSLSTITKVR